ncbi:MAG: hypothetical protein PHN79_08835 [Methanoregula sp.]|nr:hypothetical protein [Methanoregula sp.]
MQSIAGFVIVCTITLVCCAGCMVADTALSQKPVEAFPDTVPAPDLSYASAPSLTIAVQQSTEITPSAVVFPSRIPVNDTLAEPVAARPSSFSLNISFVNSTTHLYDDPYQDLVIIPGSENISVTRTFTFEFRGVEYSFEVPVSTALYVATRNSPNKQIRFNAAEQGTFYQHMMTDPAMDGFFTALIKELRRERYNGGKTLSDDEYLEMLISFVQQIEYDDTTTGNPRYPVEVIYDKMGDCDEKAILLNGILSREGYDVALLIFPTKKHATSGIRIHLATNRPSFRVFSDGQRDYVYIETTRTRLIGFYTEEYENVPSPVVVPVGNGTLQYGKIDYVMTIFSDMQAIDRQIGILEERARSTGALSPDDYAAAMSYVSTYQFVGSTNDREAAMDAIRRSELRHNSVCLSCG